MNDIRIEMKNGKANVFTPYNSNFVEKINGIGGAKWNRSDKYWEVPESAIEAVREIMKEVYGAADDDVAAETVKVKVTVKEYKYGEKSDINLLGKCLCHARGRDSGGSPGKDVAYVSGHPSSGGSAKNWYSEVPRDAIIILSNVSKFLYDAYLRNPDEDYTIELLITAKSREQLLDEKDKLLKRLQEIELELNKEPALSRATGSHEM